MRARRLGHNRRRPNKKTRPVEAIESTSVSNASPLGNWQGLGRVPARQLLALMVGAAAVIAVLFGSWMWMQSSDYRVLYSNLADKDGGTIIASLSQMNVPYKLAEGGGVIMVPAAVVHDTRLKLASQGLPKGGTVGFELVDNQKFGATQFQEQINYQRGLEGELAKSIQSLSAVQGARIHLAIPKPSVFLREQQGASASVLVTLYPGKRLDRAQVNGIMHLVASSVADLPLTNVSVVDQNGTLLSKDGGAAETGALDPTQLSYIQQIEQNTATRILGILEPMVGRNNARVQVTADVDFSRIESMAETFKPNQDKAAAAVRAQQSNQSMTTTGAGAQGVPGALSNQPPANATAPIDGKSGTAASSAATGTPTSTRKDESTSYEVDKTIQHTRNPVGEVKRMTAAVVLNYRRQTDDKGKSTSTPLTPQEMEQVNALVKEAMGFNTKRGDSLNVVNTAFNEPERETVPEVAWWKEPDTISIAKETGKYLLLVALLGYAFFGILRPGMRRALEPMNAPELQAIGGPSDAPLIAEQRGDQLQLARKMAREDPKVVANVVKSWVTKDG
jgi:flagellar M-ring protein FliF